MENRNYPDEKVERMLTKEMRWYQTCPISDLTDAVFTDDEAAVEDDVRFHAFEDEYGWEDWMGYFTDAEDGEPFTEAEGNEIKKFLRMVWDESKIKEE